MAAIPLPAGSWELNLRLIRALGSRGADGASLAVSSPKWPNWIDIWRLNGLEPAPSRTGMSGRREYPILPDPACQHGLPKQPGFLR